MPGDAAPRAIHANQFRFLAAAVIVALVLPRIAQRGMFLDGITYAVVARNMASGVGTFWQPSFSSTAYSTFFEQLPLGMGLEALAFRVFGDHLFVERVFSVLVFALTAVFVVGIWRRLLPRPYDWLPLFFWIVPSVVTWAVINNMLENTQALFTSLAVFCLISGASSARVGAALAWVAGAAVAIIAAFLTKGPVGLFPLAVPPLMILIGSERRPPPRAMLRTWIVLLVFTAAAAAALFASEAPRHAIAEFTRTHLVPALQGERGLPKKSVDVARHLTLGIWGRMAALVLVLWAVRRRRRSAPPIESTTLFFFATGLAASLPVLFSPVLAGHYFVPSVPFFALAAAAASLPAVQTFHGLESEGVRRFVPAAIGLTLVLASVLVLRVHGPLERRDSALIESLDAIGPVAPAGTTIGSCGSASADWGLRSYLQRFFRISLATDDTPSEGWFLSADQSCRAPAGCELRVSTPRLQLFRCGAEPVRLGSHHVPHVDSRNGV